ncbi:MAG: hypothetical protein QNK23_17835 [Crocinitomicaceae bacterium]|nr:hypothetical protein [Crocinitomicaceae bacterium]
MGVSEQLEDLIQEGLIKEEDGMYIKGKMKALIGKMYITKSRVAFLHRPMRINQGLLGNWIVKKMGKEPKDEMIFLLNLADIKDLKQGKFGINKNVLDFSDNKGTHHRITVKKYPEWEAMMTVNSDRNTIN